MSNIPSPSGHPRRARGAGDQRAGGALHAGQQMTVGHLTVGQLDDRATHELV